MEYLWSESVDPILNSYDMPWNSMEFTPLFLFLKSQDDEKLKLNNDSWLYSFLDKVKFLT